MVPRSHSRLRSRWVVLAVIVLVGIFAAVGGRLNDQDTPDPTFVRRDQTPDSSVDAASYRAQLDTADTAVLTDAEVSERAIAAVAAVEPAVVVVHRAAESGLLGDRERSSGDRIGSGVVIDSAGHIVASLRTTGATGDVSVTFSTGETVGATIVRVDDVLQLVLLQVEATPPGIADLAVRGPVPGEHVYAIGTPLEDFSSTVTGGVIGAIGVTLPADGVWLSIPGVVQHDAAINQGNEGGPLVNLDGEVIAINVGSVVTTASAEIAQGWAFAVPVTQLGPLLDNLN